MTENEVGIKPGRFRALLAIVKPGKITDITALEPLLGRMEGVTWEPPILSFTGERHGRTVAGSSRADLQGWTVNVEANTVSCETMGHRLVRPMQFRLMVEPLVEEVVRLIVTNQQDDRVRWHDDGSGKVLVGKIIPVDSAVKQTLVGRRKRFRNKLVGRLEAEGWVVVSFPYTFARHPEPFTDVVD